MEHLQINPEVEKKCEEVSDYAFMQGFVTGCIWTTIVVFLGKLAGVL